MIVWAFIIAIKAVLVALLIKAIVAFLLFAQSHVGFVIIEDAIVWLLGRYTDLPWYFVLIIVITIAIVWDWIEWPV